MKSSPKVVVVMPAHNAARTLARSIARLPKKFVDQIILVDDASTDNTLDIARKFHVTVYKNQINLGYGGNLKVCLTKALENGADIIIEFHPDNQYDPENLPLFLEKAKQGFDFALGSRFIHPKEALERHMPLTKFIANRSLSFIDQFVLGIELSEFHSGFRMYTRRLLKNVPFLQNSDDYLFSFEIIVQAVYFKYKIAEVQISCDYHSAMHTANLRRSTIYALGTFKTLYQYIQSKFLNHQVGPFIKFTSGPCPICKQKITRHESMVKDAVSHDKFAIYFCTPCQIGFTVNPPKDLSAYYPNTYYSNIKNTIYNLLQWRRIKFIRKLISIGKVLDIGCGEGNIGYKLVHQGYVYQGIETPFSIVNNPYVRTVGVEGLKEKSHSYDVVTFWESFEHLKNPLIVLKKSSTLLKKNGHLIIECPNFGSWEKMVFGSHWFHLDPPRHIFHFTTKGLYKLLQDNEFIPIYAGPIYAPEYIPIGLAQSVLYSISPNLNVFAQKYSKTSTYLIPLALVLLAIFMVPVSYIIYLLNGSPIQLVIARKK